MTLVLKLKAAMVSKCAKCPRGAKNERSIKNQVSRSARVTKGARVEKVPSITRLPVSKGLLGKGCSQELFSSDKAENFYICCIVPIQSVKILLKICEF